MLAVLLHLYDVAPKPFIDLAQWSALVGFLLPLLVAVIQRPSFSKPMRTVIGIIASAIAAFFTAWAQDKLSLAGWANSFIFVAITSWTTYLAVWVPAGAAAWVEAKTTPGATVVKDATATPVATTTGQPPSQ
jgi:hypothetical protein